MGKAFEKQVKTIEDQAQKQVDAFEKQIKTIEDQGQKQVQALRDLKPKAINDKSEKKIVCQNLQLYFTILLAKEKK